MKQTIFFAFQSSHRSMTSDNVDAIRTAVSLLNSNDDSRFYAKSWEDLRISGRIINKSIFDAIDSSDIFACDLTFLNHNVLFELGYAIGKQKKLIILINTNEAGAVQNYDSLDIMKNVGYTTFCNGLEIYKAVNADSINKTVLIEEIVNINSVTINSHDIFYIRNNLNNQADIDAYTWLSKSEYQVIYDDELEVEYRPLKWYVETVIKCSSIIIHIAGTSKSSSLKGNAKASLYAGLGCGLGKSVLLLAPTPYNAPIDYEDILVQYENTTNCVEKLDAWTEKHVKKNANPERESDRELNLLKLGLGYDVAEHERDKLYQYFVETKSYYDALISSRLIFVGRKGTGKTAIFIMLDNNLRSDSTNIVISLKPESSELLSNIEVHKMYSSEASKQSFFHTIWKVVIYSKILLHLVTRILDKNTLAIKSFEQDLVNFTNQNEELLNKHFLEIINIFYEKYKNQDTNLLSQVYRDYINPMIKMVKEYFSNTKYMKVAIIADNLDKSWDIKNDLQVQTDMIFTLFEVTGEIKNELRDKKSNSIDTKVILFLRKDIFSYMVESAREPDKIMLFQREIDWSAFPGLLQKVIEKRFAYVLEIVNPSEIEKVWSDYFSISLRGRQTVFQRISEACIPRPRDILFFMGQMFESAYNNGSAKVTEKDFRYAIDVYSRFLYLNIIAEMSTDYPEIKSVLFSLHNKFGDKMEYTRFFEEVVSIINDEDRAVRLIDSLFRNEYFIALNEKTADKYQDHRGILEAQNADKGLLSFFRSKKNIYVQLQPMYRRNIKS